MVDMLEPWVLKATLVVGTLAAVNVWLFVLSTKLTPHVPATDRPQHERSSERQATIDSTHRPT
jgi:hypothetical protein